MKSAKKHIECFEDYRCKVIEQFKSAVPDDYVVTMRLCTLATIQIDCQTIV